MDLVQECTFTATLAVPLPIGTGPNGTRMYFGVDGGEVTGERLRGTILGGGEWALIGPDGYLRVDVRLQVQTHDDAFLYVQYVGLLELNEAVQRAMESGRGTDFDDQAFYTNPRFETGDPRYAWLNRIICVGSGAREADAVLMAIFEVL